MRQQHSSASQALVRGGGTRRLGPVSSAKARREFQKDSLIIRRTSMAAGSSAQQIAQAMAYWRLLVRYKWHILVGTFALTLASAVVIACLPSVYEATTTILVDPQQIPEKYVGAVSGTDPYSRLNTITQEVLSRTRLQEIVNKFDLYPELRKSLSPEELIAKMRDDITIQVKEGSGQELSAFTITYDGRQPTMVAAVANELAASFIEWNVDSREEQVAGTKEFFSSELQAAKKSLEQQEDMLRRFKMSHLGEMPDQTASNLQALSSLRSALQANTEAMNRMDEERFMLTRQPESVAGAANPAVSLTERGRAEFEKRQLEASIEQLRTHYSDSYPDVVKAERQLEEINARLASLPPDAVDPAPHETDVPSATRVRLELIDKEMKRLNAEQNQMEAQMADYQAKLDAAPLREQQLVELTRNYDTSKQNYEALLNESLGINMAADLEQKQKGERFTALDTAQVPTKPVRPKRKRLIALSILAAFGLSISLVLAKGALSAAIQTEVELKSLLPKGVRVMGLVPLIEIAADARRRRRLAISASLACILLGLALIGVLWRIRPVL
jgi:polysaccharide biosynthesis transport protein